MHFSVEGSIEDKVLVFLVVGTLILFAIRSCKALRLYWRDGVNEVGVHSEEQPTVKKRRKATATAKNAKRRGVP